MQTVRRTLVKSPPELWAELSDPEALARHLDPFGPVTITGAQPERAVAWEGEHASGEVVLEPAGWGTRVTLTADPVAAEPAAPEPEPVTAELPAVPAAAPRRGLLGRLLARLRPAAETPAPPSPGPDPAPPTPTPSPGPPAPPGPNPPQIRLDPDTTASVLAGVLDDLGAAHHRPFSR